MILLLNVKVQILIIDTYYLGRVSIKLGEKGVLLEEINHYKNIVSQSIKLQNEHESFYSKPAFIIALGIRGRIITFHIVWFILG